MSLNKSMQRRTFLKGLGAAIALPMLDSVIPVRAFAGTAASATAAPLRMAFMYVPNGVHLPHWTPGTEGALLELPRILQPLTPFKRDLLVMSGLTQDKGRANGDAAGDHARAATSFLTGSQPLKTEGAIRAGISVDQIAARTVGQQTRFASLQIGAEGGRQSGQCDSGYSCAYSNNISWQNETTPLAKEVNPRLVFERLFANELQGEVSASQAKRQRYRKSILDFVLEDAKSLSAKVNGSDKQKLDEYLTSIREIETRIERAERLASVDKSEYIAEFDRPSGIPETYEEHIRLMGDMMVLAFQSDVTRIATFMFANEGSNRNYRAIGVSEGHHELSHHQGDPLKHEHITQINHFHVNQFAYILQRLSSIKEDNGTLLDNCMIVYGSSISDGNRHNHEDLPIIMAGRGGGTIQTGRHLRYPTETPLNNLFLSMLDRIQAPVDSFGDSTGRLRNLTA